MNISGLSAKEERWLKRKARQAGSRAAALRALLRLLIADDYIGQLAAKDDQSTRRILDLGASRSEIHRRISAQRRREGLPSVATVLDGLETRRWAIEEENRAARARHAGRAHAKPATHAPPRQR